MNAYHCVTLHVVITMPQVWWPMEVQVVNWLIFHALDTAYPHAASGRVLLCNNTVMCHTYCMQDEELSMSTPVFVSMETGGHKRGRTIYRHLRMVMFAS